MFQTTNQIYLLKMAIEIVDLPMNSMVIFHSYVTVYQRVIGKDGTYRNITIKNGGL